MLLIFGGLISTMAYLSRGLDGVDKAQYYVWYLGWKESAAIGGRAHTEPVVKELIARRRSEDELAKMTIEVNPTELRIVQLIEGKKGKIERRRHPSVPARDVTYAVQALSPDEDVVACIYLGFNPQTRRVVHVHAYRCDSADTAKRMVDHVNRIIALPEYRERVRGIEAELVQKGHVVPRPVGLGDAADDVDTMAGYKVGNNNRSTTPLRNKRTTATPPTTPPIPPSGSTNPGGFTSLASELLARLGNKQSAPILLPVKDYGTWESIGNQNDIENRKCRNVDLVGVKGAGLISENISQGKSGTGMVTVISLGEGGEVNVDSGRRKPPVPIPVVRQPDLRKESSGGEDSARGDSDIGSNRNSTKSDDNHSPLLPPTSRPFLNGATPERLRLSSGFHDDYLDDDDDVALTGNDDTIHAITPRWKKSQVFVPAARPADGDLSPEYESRLFAPGPIGSDLQRFNSVDAAGDLPPHVELSPRSGSAPSRHSTHSSGSSGHRRKYTPSTLGLVPAVRDEGYRSMDRGEVPSKYFDHDVTARMPSHDRYYGAESQGCIVYRGTGDDVPVDYDETLALRKKSSRQRLPRMFDRR